MTSVSAPHDFDFTLIALLLASVIYCLTISAMYHRYGMWQDFLFGIF